MATGDVSLTRGVGYRDDMINANNWSTDAGVSVSSDGDILTISGMTATNGASSNIGGSLSTNTYKGFAIKILGVDGTNAQLTITFADATNQTYGITINTSTYTTYVFSPNDGTGLTAAKTLSSMKFIQNGASSIKIDFIFFLKEYLVLPAASQPMNMTLQRWLVKLPIPTREGEVVQDLGSQSAGVELAGTLITTTSPNNYTGNQWWDVLVGSWLEANWQFLASDRISGKYQIEQLMPTQDPGKVGYYGYKIRLVKVDVLSATGQTFQSNTGTGAIQ